jgi:hypothetical protein
MFELFFLCTPQESLPKSIPSQPAIVRAWDGTSEGMSARWVDLSPGKEEADAEADLPEEIPVKMPTEMGRPVIVSGNVAVRPCWSGHVEPYPVW